MDGFDSELARLRAQIARSEQLRARLRDLYPRREQLAAQEEELREKRVDEQEDVDRLEAKSLARYFFTLTGSLDERLDRERAEAREAAVRHDALLEELRDVEEDIAESESELAGLSGCEQQYDELRGAERHARAAPTRDGGGHTRGAGGVWRRGGRRARPLRGLNLGHGRHVQRQLPRRYGQVQPD